MKTREYMMDRLEYDFKMGFVAITENFNSSERGIWLSGENGETAKDGRLLFDYYTEDYDHYNFGVHIEIEQWAEKHGWAFEWNDPGTIMLWPND